MTLHIETFKAHKKNLINELSKFIQSNRAMEIIYEKYVKIAFSSWKLIKYTLLSVILTKIENQ